MKNLKFVLLNILVLVIGLSAIEVTITFLLNNPSVLPKEWLPDFRSYYMTKDREIAQYSPHLAAYDSQLFYKLKPGEHAFSNREFDTKFSVNQYGFRDDENSVKKPKIIFLGDSFTMGWGVEDAECYVSILEQNTGLTTLNTGVSSYGTVREFEVFSQLQKDSLQYLVIQFDVNDTWENLDFSYEGNKYTPNSKNEYENVKDQHLKAISYFPFKHTSHFFRNYLESRFPELFTKDQGEETDVEKIERPYITPVDAFINVLAQGQIPDSIPIIIFQVGDGSKEVLIDPLTKLVSEKKVTLLNPIYVLDMQSRLSEADYYLLDTHLKPEGHRIVGNSLSKFIKQLDN
ncbi:MAG: hypothetical protein K9G41_02025 [Flavobacteriales bacterium]|nr:hypothetical protein [Flavobacteriales bacterium]